jgi:hypothetical protein
MNTGGYLTLAQAGQYCGGRSARWARRHLLPNIHHIHPPSSGVLFRREDVDAWLEKYRKEPIDLDCLMRDVLGKRQKNRLEGRKIDDVRRDS